MNTEQKEPVTDWDVVIIGGGVAGLSSALILARARRRVLVLDGGEPRNRFAARMHGVLGRDGYAPLDLVHDGRREVEESGGVHDVARVARIQPTAHGFSVTTEGGASITTRRVIVATGIRDVLPAIAGLAEQWGRGVVACPYCDGYEARGSRIGVIAGSVAGLHKAHMIRSYSPTVTVFTSLIDDQTPDHDLHALRARGIDVDDRDIVSITSSAGNLSGVEFADGSEIGLDRVFIDPDALPLDDLLQQLGADRIVSDRGTWTVRDDTFQTSVPGVWAVGNVANPAALVPVAMGEGVAAATAIDRAIVTEEVAEAASAISVPGT